MDRARLPGAPPFPVQFDFNHQPILDPYDAFVSQATTPGVPPAVYLPQYAPYEVDVRTERQTFVNDVPFRHDSSVSTFSTLGPPQLHATLPSFHADDWLQEDCFNQENPHTELNPVFNHQVQTSPNYGYTHTSQGTCSNQANPPAQLDPALKDQVEASATYYTHSLTVPVEEYDEDEQLLNHFAENVFRMLFPVLEVHPPKRDLEASLKTFKLNISSFHTCLSEQLESSVDPANKKIHNAIMQHRYGIVAQLAESYNKEHEEDKDCLQMLDTTLALILFNCAVSAPNDGIIDIPWSDHFQALSRLVDRLEPSIQLASTGTPPDLPESFQFRMSLVSWIDILGATMMGTRPKFADYYRTKLPNGLRELMGCDDYVMYLIAEIACLDAAKCEGLDDACVHYFVSALGAELHKSELADRTLYQLEAGTGTNMHKQLTHNVTAIFRCAARIYLCSLIPGFHRYQTGIQVLVSSMTNGLQFVPFGPDGFDRALVWPLLIAGWVSTPESEFRTVLHVRVTALGKVGQFGSFGSMINLLNTVWEKSGDPPQFLVGKRRIQKQEESSHSTATACGIQPNQEQSVHWRDIMNRGLWQHLLI